MLFFLTWMDLEMIILSETEKDEYHISFICTIKKNINKPIYKTEIVIDE